jgi:Cof subfamily protein (haloacid dehalogenase superfamily)
MKFDMIISDFDRTLGGKPKEFDTNGAIGEEKDLRMNFPEPSIKAIKQYTDKGGIFVVCTGRATEMILPLCREKGLKGLVVSFQGARITDIETGKDLLCGGVDKQLAVQVAKELEQEKGVLATVCYIDEIQYLDKENVYTDICSSFLKTQKVESIANTIIEKGKNPYKLVAVCAPEDVKEFENKYNTKYNGVLSFNSGADIICEVINPNLDKGSAVRFLAKHYGVPYEKIMTVGDSSNDIPLINGEWYGVSVGDGHEKLKEVADEITVDFKDHPIKVLLEKYCL